MPNKKNKHADYKSCVVPVDSQTAQELNQIIVDAFERKMLERDEDQKLPSKSMK